MACFNKYKFYLKIYKKGREKIDMDETIWVKLIGIVILLTLYIM